MLTFIVLLVLLTFLQLDDACMCVSRWRGFSCTDVSGMDGMFCKALYKSFRSHETMKFSSDTSRTFRVVCLVYLFIFEPP